MNGQRRAWLWPRGMFLAVAALPVLAFLFLVLTLVRESVPAVTQLGLGHLFSTEYSGRFSTGYGLYGLIPPIWGTIMVTFLAIGVALPVSLALAIFTTEFNLGRVSRFVSAVLGFLSGIPPIVYALMGVVLVRALIGPKLCAEDLPTDVAAALPGLPTWNAGTLPNSMPNSALLAGLLLGLLAIPFMTPLIQDAIRSVPSSLREASWALGATRWHTLRRVVLPGAMPGLLGAAAMGMLKCAGEVVIVSYVVGYEGSLPSPLWDVLERVPVLTSTGAGLQGGLSVSAEGATDLDISVGYFAGLILLVFAVAMLAAAFWLENTLRRRQAV